MTPKHIFEKNPGLSVIENRHIGDERVEIVFLNAQLKQWQAHLEMFLGPALKPVGIQPQPEHEAMTRTYGGIRAGQTLFGKTLEGKRIIALFWPWQDGVNITLKMYMESEG